jgi:2-polyprenyl-6-methoxyphenol hydroxylase-like FAD-dependent oxidoreductase
MDNKRKDDTTMKVGIIGGGIAGLTMALALQKAGIAFHLFEQATAFKEVGAGIGISSSAFELLKRLGVGDAFLQDAIKLDGLFIANKNLKKVLDVPFDGVGYSIHRMRLIELLQKPLPQHSYTLNTKIEQVTETDQDVTIITNTGSKYVFDVLVAADGIHSTIRKQVLPQISPRYSGQIMWRGIAEVTLEKKFTTRANELWGMNRRFGVVPMKDGRYFWYAIKFAPAKQQDNPATIHVELKTLFEPFHPVTQLLIEHTKNILRTDLNDIAPSKAPWHTKRIVFVGDSIHACTPHLSQGACQAIESAYTLALCLQQFDVHNAMQQYQQLRQKKITYINEMSWFFGRFSHLRKEWRDKLVHTGMSMLPKPFLKYRFDKMVELKYLKGLEQVQ